jgi:5-methylthioadenosine/S-adenosylhomocysteine deaminase
MDADVVVVDLDKPHLVPLHDPVTTLVYAARGSDVVMTVVRGDVVFENGSCTRVDEARLLEEARTHAAELVRRAGLTGREPRSSTGS